MSLTSPSSCIYQLRVVLRGVRPLIWRQLLVPSDSTVEKLHSILLIAFNWTDDHLHAFRIHGKEYSYYGDAVRLEDLRLRRGEKFLYSYDFTAGWECDIRLEAVLPREPRRCYPACVGGERAAPPDDCPGTWAYMEWLDRHKYDFPFEEMRIVTEAVERLLEADRNVLVRDAVGDMDELQEAVEHLDAYDRFQPEHFDRRYVNAQLRAWAQNQGGRPGDTARRVLRGTG